jgi:hypothetical protein
LVVDPSPCVNATWCHLESQADNEAKEGENPLNDRNCGDLPDAHFTQALALHAEFPLGNTEKSALPTLGVRERELPNDRISASFTSPNGLVS